MINDKQHVYIQKFMNKIITGNLSYSIFLALVMATAIWFSYSHCLNADFQMDDFLQIVNNSAIHMKDFSWGELLTFEGMGKSRPVVFASLKLNYYFSWLKPHDYRLTNVVIHIVTSMLFFFILSFTCRKTGFAAAAGNDNPTIRRWITTAFFAVMAWALSPLSTAAVTYIVQRAVSLSAMFCLFAMGCYILGRIRFRNRSWPWYALAIVFWLLAVGSKQPAILLPVGILLYDIYFFRDGRLFSTARYNQTAWRVFLVVTALAMGLILWKGYALVDLIGGEKYARYPFDLYQRLLSFPRILFYYLGLIFFPLPERIAVDPSFVTHSVNFIKPWTTVPAWILLVFLFYLAWFLRHRERIISFGILWFVLFLLIEQTFIPLQLVFHHRLYLPSMFILAGIVLFLCRQAENFKITGPGLVIGTCVIAMLGLGTYQRNDRWNHPFQIWEAELKLDPDSARIMINLSREYMKIGMNQQAIALLFKLLEKDPKDIRAYMNIANAYTMMNQPEQAIFFLQKGASEVPKWPNSDAYRYLMIMAKDQMALQQFDKAEASYLKARDVVQAKDQASFHLKLSDLYHRMGKNQDAIAMAEQAVAFNEKYYEAQFFLGSLFAVAGNYEQAAAAFEKAIGGEDMINGKAYRHLANLAEWQDDQKKALSLYKKALEYIPNDFDTMMNIGTILAKSEKFDEAKNIFRQALLVGNVFKIYRAYFNIGIVGLRQGDARAALKNLEKAYHLNPRDTGTLYSLGNLYLDIGQLQEGTKLLEALLRLDIDHPQKKMIIDRIQKNAD